MTITKKESEWAKRLTMWFSLGRIVWGVVIAGAVFGVKEAESRWVRPYVEKVSKCQYDKLHAPADTMLQDIGYQVKLVRKILQLSVGDSVFAIAKEDVDESFWRKKF